MSRIGIITADYQRRINPNSNSSNSYKAPNFKGAGTIAKTAEELAVEAYSKNIDSSLGWIGKLTSYLNKNDGEVQNQLGNALFTSTLAPVVIAYNPLSDEDPNIKKYSAVRQPLSAVLAIAFGLGITMPADNFVENLANKGYIPTIDLRMQENEKYLRRVFKKEFKKAEKENKVEEFINKNKPEGWSGSKNDYSVENFITSRHEKAKELYTKLLIENPDAIKGDSSLISGFKNIDKFLEANNLHKVKFSTYLKENFGVEFFEDEVNGTKTLNLKLDAFDKKSQEIKAIDFLKKMGFVDDKYSEADLRIAMNKKREETLIDAAKKFNPTSTEDEARGFVKEVGKTISRAMEYTISSKLIKEESISLHQLLERFNISQDTLKNATNKNMIDVLKELSEKYLNEIEGVKGKSVNDFGKQILNNKIKRVAADFKNFKKYTGIFVALFSLPFSCGALNWTYPRMIEKFFPSLAKAKSQKGENK